MPWAASQGRISPAAKDLICGLLRMPPDERLTARAENDYLIDRAVQKAHSFTGIQGTRAQDAAMTESMGAITDRSREHLATSDQAIIAIRRLLLDSLERHGAGEEVAAMRSGAMHTAITQIYPELKGKLNGHAVRVPLLNASLTDCVFELSREVTAAEVNELFQAAAAGPLKGILGFEHRPLVSADFLNDPRSSIVDGPATMVVDGTQVKVYAWYDNEWGYACRLGDIARMVAASL